ncbi:hypothetical protein [Novosphingobium beihaiensis]|uniref:DUF3551 domain-containing protein n=1 Tax=Novosphingobium beihaiensis TaxID=2930389 RepID=A0ABT0BNG9_9SPHN|nr:hypothetical protein [Novosphingobium beihaiensis]MCJ2186591.1 hypothetical protein [Novosphingobium beihaiensis]
MSMKRILMPALVMAMATITPTSVSAQGSEYDACMAVAHANYFTEINKCYSQSSYYQRTKCLSDATTRRTDAIMRCQDLL